MVEIYHGSREAVRFPALRKAGYTMDFSWGFYCTESLTEAQRHAWRCGSRGMVSVYRYTPDESLRILRFDAMTDGWLDFIAFCRAGNVHDYDIVEGPMADAGVSDPLNCFLAGDISRAAFRELVRSKEPSRQISFHSMRALGCLNFLRSAGSQA